MSRAAIHALRFDPTSRRVGTASSSAPTSRANVLVAQDGRVQARCRRARSRRAQICRALGTHSQSGTAGGDTVAVTDIIVVVGGGGGGGSGRGIENAVRKKKVDLRRGSGFSVSFLGGL